MMSSHFTPVTLAKPCPPHRWAHSPTVGSFDCMDCRKRVGFADAEYATLSAEREAGLHAINATKPVEGDAVELVKRLRYWASNGHPHGLLHGEAADFIEALAPQPGNDEVIERVRALVEYQREWDGGQGPVEVEFADLRHLLTLAKPSHQADGERDEMLLSLQGEAERLREALRKIASLTDEQIEVEGWSPQNIAHNALNPVPSSGEGGGE